jgi:hypothetical protein
VGGVQGRGHRAAGDPERLGDPRVVKVGVVAEEERQPLALGERSERCRSGARLAVPVGGGLLGGFEGRGRVPALDARVLSSLVEDDPADPPGRSLALAQPAPVANGAHKRVVDSVVGGLLVTGDGRGEPHERPQLISVDGFNGGQVRISLGAAPHTHMIPRVSRGV